MYVYIYIYTLYIHIYIYNVYVVCAYMHNMLSDMICGYMWQIYIAANDEILPAPIPTLPGSR